MRAASTMTTGCCRARRVAATAAVVRLAEARGGGRGSRCRPHPLPSHTSGACHCTTGSDASDWEGTGAGKAAQPLGRHPLRRPPPPPLPPPPLPPPSPPLVVAPCSGATVSSSPGRAAALLVHCPTRPPPPPSCTPRAQRCPATEWAVKASTSPPPPPPCPPRPPGPPPRPAWKAVSLPRHRTRCYSPPPPPPPRPLHSPAPARPVLSYPHPQRWPRHSGEPRTQRTHTLSLQPPPPHTSPPSRSFLVITRLELLLLHATTCARRLVPSVRACRWCWVAARSACCRSRRCSSCWRGTRGEPLRQRRRLRRGTRMAPGVATAATTTSPPHRFGSRAAAGGGGR